jgi:hypothetical protein
MLYYPCFQQIGLEVVTELLYQAVVQSATCFGYTYIAILRERFVTQMTS